MLQSDAHSSITLEISVLVPEPAPPQLSCESSSALGVGLAGVLPPCPVPPKVGFALGL